MVSEKKKYKDDKLYGKLQRAMGKPVIFSKATAEVAGNKFNRAMKRAKSFWNDDNAVKSKKTKTISIRN